MNAKRGLGLLDRSRRHLHRRDRPRPGGRLHARKLLSESPAYEDAAVEAIRRLLALRRASRSRPARSASSRWARRSRPTRCSSGAASARCWSRRAAFAMRSRSATRRDRTSSPATSRSPSSSIRASIEVDERVLADGTVEAAPDLNAVRAALARSAGRTATTRSRSCSCTPTAIPRTSARSARSRARSASRRSRKAMSRRR